VQVMAHGRKLAVHHEREAVSRSATAESMVRLRRAPRMELRMQLRGQNRSAFHVLHSTCLRAVVAEVIVLAISWQLVASLVGHVASL
jgi:hypothetical protein